MRAEKFVRVEKGEYSKPKQADSNGISDILTQLEPIPGSPTWQNFYMHLNEIQKKYNNIVIIFRVRNQLFC